MERKLSKKMSPNSRPPLTSRIRASFDGKRSKSEVTSPTLNGFSTQDPDLLRHAIDEAISSETFQIAIAANLAKLIKPSIKSALDTIQPVVETVYNHEVLLRKTNQSVENILERLDTVTEAPIEDEDGEEEKGDPSIPVTPRKRAIISTVTSSADVEGVKQLFAQHTKQNDAKLSELSSSVESNNNKIAEIMEGIAGINAALWPTREALDSLKSFSDHSSTTTSVMQAQLDQLNADVGVIMEAIGSDLGSNVKAITQQVAIQNTSLLSTHTTKLDEISTDIAALKGHAGTVDLLKDISANLEVVNENVQAGIASSNENFTTIQPQLVSVLGSIKAHSNKLGEINPGDNAEVLAAIQKSNDSHAAHAAALGEIKERGLAGGPQSAPASSDAGTVAVLQALAADLASLKEDVEVGLATNHEDVSGLGIKVDDVLTTLKAHRAADPSADILAAVQKSNDSHASHAEALDGIRTITAQPRVTTSSDSSASSLEPHFATIIAKLDSHSTMLEDIKASSTPGTDVVPATGATNLDGLESQITTIINTLESHSTVLTEIKDDVSAEILTVLHDINEAHATQNTLLTEIRESDVSDEILTALHASNDSHANHTTVLADLHAAMQASNDSHASHSGVLEEIKATRSMEPAEASGAHSNLGEFGTQISVILTTLEDQNATLSGIKAAADASNQSHLAHTSTLTELKSIESDAAAAVPSGLGALDGIIATLEDQNMTLSAIKEATDASIELNVAHGSTLAEIKDAIAASREIHTSHTALLGDIKSTIDTSTDSQDAHRSALSEIKDITLTSNGFHSSHMETLGELKEAVIATNDSHASHSADLAQIKDATKAANDLHASHIVALTELKSANPDQTTTSSSSSGGGDLGALETHVNAIITTLDTQNATLSEIKEIVTTPEVLAAVNESHELLKSYTPLLNAIKDGQSHEDILANIAALKEIIEESRAGIDNHGAVVKDLHESTKASHSEIATAIGALALGGAAGAGSEALTSKNDDSSAEILEEVKAVRAIVETSSASIETVKETTASKDRDSSSELLEEVKAVRAVVEKSSTSIETVKETTTSMAAQIDINHTTVTTSINTLSDELKAEVDATGTDISTSLEALSGDFKALDDSVKNSSTHVEGLVDGVHLSEKGLGQLKEHAAVHSSTGNIPRPRRENWWKEKGVDDFPVPMIHEPPASPVHESLPSPTIHVTEPEPEPSEKELEASPIIDNEPSPAEEQTAEAPAVPDDEATHDSDPKPEPNEEEPESSPVVNVEAGAVEEEASAVQEPAAHQEVRLNDPEPASEAKEEELEASPIVEDGVVLTEEEAPAVAVPAIHEEDQAVDEPEPELEPKEEYIEAPVVVDDEPVSAKQEVAAEEPATQEEERSSVDPEPEPLIAAVEEEPESHTGIESEPAAAEPESADVEEHPAHEEESTPAESVEEAKEVKEEEPTAEAHAAVPEYSEDEPETHHVIESEAATAEPEETHIEEPAIYEEESTPAEPVEEVKEVEASPETHDPVPEPLLSPQIIDDPDMSHLLLEPESNPEPKEEEPIEHSEEPIPEADESESATPQDGLEDDPVEEEVEHTSIGKEAVPTQEEEPSHADPALAAELDLEDDSTTAYTESASTSAIASPMSPSFPGEGSSAGGKKGKKGKKGAKEKKLKKDKKAQFVFDPDEEEEKPAA